MKLQINLWLSIIILIAVHSKAKDLNLTLEFEELKPELRPNNFLEWLLSIFLPPALIPTTTLAPTTLKECLPCTCGTPNTVTRIVGGEESEMLHYPWMALLTYDGMGYCGGALITDLYVATAAHCFPNLNISLVAVRLLVHNKTENTMKEIYRTAAKIIKHEDYNQPLNDIALIKLSEPVEFSDMLRPVCLPSGDALYTGETGIVTGWGRTSERGNTSDILLQVNVPIISNEDCLKYYAYSDFITPRVLCAGYEKGGKDSCQGDSGGPLHLYSENLDIYQLIGIVSFGVGCARPKKPGVYTRITKYREWLEKHLEGSCKCEEPTMKLSGLFNKKINKNF